MLILFEIFLSAYFSLNVISYF